MVVAIFKKPADYKDKIVPIAGELTTPAKIASQFAQVTGLPARY